MIRPSEPPEGGGLGAAAQAGPEGSGDTAGGGAAAGEAASGGGGQAYLSRGQKRALQRTQARAGAVGRDMHHRLRELRPPPGLPHGNVGTSIARCVVNPCRRAPQGHTQSNPSRQRRCTSATQPLTTRLKLPPPRSSRHRHHAPHALHLRHRIHASQATATTPARHRHHAPHATTSLTPCTPYAIVTTPRTPLSTRVKLQLPSRPATHTPPSSALKRLRSSAFLCLSHTHTHTHTLAPTQIAHTLAPGDHRTGCGGYSTLHQTQTHTH